VRGVDAVKESTKETNSRKLERGETNVLEDGRTDVKGDIPGLADSSKLHARPDNTCQAEDDEK